MTKSLPLIFFGSNNFSIYVLKEFLKKYKPLLVATLPPKPAGRKLKIQPNPVYLFCLKEKLNVVEIGKKDSSYNWDTFAKDLELIKPETGVIASFGKIIPKKIIELFPKGILNLHPSLLPRHRGPNPIRETIIQGDSQTGITLFIIDELVDHGPILVQETTNLNNRETYLELEEKLGRLGGKILNEKIEDYLADKIIPQPQDETLATYTSKIEKENGLLSLEDNFLNWDRKIRAYNPWPGTFIYLQPSQKLLKIFSIEKLKEGDLPREILKTKVGNFFVFKNELGLHLNDAFILLKEVQLESKKKMSGKEFLNGFRHLIFSQKT